MLDALPEDDAVLLPERVVDDVFFADVAVVLADVVDEEVVAFAVVTGVEGGFRYEAADVLIAVCICVVSSPKGTPFA